MGSTTVFPRMDPTRPADVHPPDILDAIETFQADQSFGSPALWNTVSRYCEKHGLTVPTIKRVLTAGAPVPPDTLRRVKQIIAEDGDAYTPYGATEALPVACNSATTVLEETAERTNRGGGTCIGKPFAGIEWKLIQISDDPLTQIEQTKAVAGGEIGELMVQGPVVTDQYVTQTDANAYHKVQDGERFWHRMGDVGYFDEQGRFWFCGRKSHRVQTAGGTHFTIPCEAIVNTHADIYRSALVGVGPAGQQQPVMIVEPLPDRFPANDAAQQQLLDQIHELCQAHETTAFLSRECLLIHEKLPTDIRHNSKIFREQLRGWAETRI